MTYHKLDEWAAILRQIHEGRKEPTPGAMMMAKEVNDELKRRLAEAESEYDYIPSDSEPKK
jgi:hypothetical protein